LHTLFTTKKSLWNKLKWFGMRKVRTWQAKKNHWKEK
jgi:hypothetical protein